MQEKKKCTRCEFEKFLESDFSLRKESKDGHKSSCKSCLNALTKIYRKENKNKIKEYASSYHRKNKSRLNVRRRKYRIENEEKTKEYNRKYRKENKEKIQEYNSEYYKKNHALKMWLNARKRSKERKIPFDILVSDVHIPDECPVLGIKLRIGIGKKEDFSPSLDKIIPELGYIKGNIIVISDLANRIKSNATPEQIRKVAEFYGKQNKGFLG